MEKVTRDMKQNIEPKIIALFARIMQVDASVVDKNASPDTIASWDSLQHMKLVLALEEEFGVEFNEDQIIQMISLSKIFLILDEMLNNPP